MLAALTWQQIEEALAAHPRIGQPPHASGQEASWSRREQAGVDDAAVVSKAELAAANLAYETRFDRVFLICATGLSANDIVAAATARMDNNEEAERTVVRTELGRIVALRLEKLVAA